MGFHWCWWHYGHDFTARLPSPLIWHGYLAVDLFFVLSGFVMAFSYGAAFKNGFSAGEYGGFLVKRLARIYPMFFVATLATVALALIRQDGGPSLWLLGQNLLLIQSWGFGHSIDFPAWSISTEFGAYLLFPALVALTLAGGRRRVAFAALAACLCLAGLAVLPSVYLNQVMADGTEVRMGPLDVSGGYMPFLVVRCVAGFVLGLVSYRLLQDRRVRRVAAHPAAAWAAVLAFVALLSVKGGDVAIVLACVPLVMTLAAGRSVFASALGWGPIHWLGEISYSIYLIHILVLDVVSDHVRPAFSWMGVPHAALLAFALQPAILVGLAAACFYLIERPARQVGRKLVPRAGSRETLRDGSGAATTWVSLRSPILLDRATGVTPRG